MSRSSTIERRIHKSYPYSKLLSQLKEITSHRKKWSFQTPNRCITTALARNVGGICRLQSPIYCSDAFTRVVHSLFQKCNYCRSTRWMYDLANSYVWFISQSNKIKYELLKRLNGSIKFTIFTRITFNVNIYMIKRIINHKKVIFYS